MLIKFKSKAILFDEDLPIQQHVCIRMFIVYSEKVL